MDGTIQSLNKHNSTRFSHSHDWTATFLSYTRQLSFTQLYNWQNLLKGLPSLLRIVTYSFCLYGSGSSVLFSFHHQDWQLWALEPAGGHKMLAHLKCYDLCSVQFLNIITLKWLDCVIIRVAERQAKYDHYSCYYFLWSSRTMVAMINGEAPHWVVAGSHTASYSYQLSITTKSIAGEPELKSRKCFPNYSKNALPWNDIGAWKHSPQ